MNFLTQMSAGWNISLFHYRNHGADYGRAGRHAGAAGRHGRIQEFLQKLGYAHWDESQNRPTSCSSAARPQLPAANVSSISFSGLTQQRPWRVR
jgi:hypothetical protein